MTQSSLRKYVAAIFILAVSTSVAASPRQAVVGELDVSLSSREAYVGVPITLYVRINNAASHTQPAIPNIDGADVVSSGVPSRSSQTTIINGRRSDRTSLTYAWQITPRRSGRFEVPPIPVEIDGRRDATRPLSFNATKSETGDLLFVEVEGQRDRIYVGQPLELKLKIWLKPFHDAKYDVTLSASDMWNLVSAEHSNWGAFAETLRDLAEAGQRVEGRAVLRDDDDGDSQAYYLYEIPATVYPKRPGQVDTDDVQIVVEYPTSLTRSRSFFSAGGLAIDQVRPIVSDASVPSTQVVATPTEGRPADYRGAVGRYEIITQATPTDVKAGDPITLHIGIRGDGPMDLVQAPPLAQLSELARDFKVPDEALAGVVEGDVKVFSVSIRPRRAGITEVPSIPLSYFNPHSEQFLTAHSEPISIRVGESDSLSFASIVAAGGRSTTADNQDDPPEAVSHVSFQNHDGSELLKSAAPRSLGPMLIGLLLAPLVFAVVSVTKHRERIVEWIGFSRTVALRRSQNALAAAETAEEVANAVLTFVAERLGLSAGRLTRSEAIRALRAGGIEAGVQELDNLLGLCETSCYAGNSEGNAQSLAAVAAECLDIIHGQPLNLERRRPTARRLPSMAKGATTAIVMLSLFAVAGTQPANAAQLSDVQATQILSEASEAYRQGQASPDDAATAKESFALAAERYQTLIDDGVDNGKLYFNLANAYSQSGDLGRALANYERALSLLPSDPSVLANRDQVRAALSGEETIAAKSIWQQLVNWNRGLSVDGRVVFGLMAWSALWLAFVGASLRAAFPWRRVAIPAALCFAICAGSLGLQWLEPPAPVRGVVVATEIVLRQGNGESFAAVDGSSLDIGVDFEVIQQRGDWLQVVTFDGRTGWILGAGTELIRSRDWRAI